MNQRFYVEAAGVKKINQNYKTMRVAEDVKFYDAGDESVV